MNLQDIAAVVTILAFVGAITSKIWRVIRKPIMLIMIAAVSGVIAILEFVRKWMRSRISKEEDSNNIGVTGGYF